MNDGAPMPAASATETSALSEALRTAARLLRIVLLGLAPIYALSGMTVVRQHERAVPLVLGRAGETVWEPGLHWTWPRPIAEVRRVDAAHVRILEWMPLTARNDSGETAPSLSDADERRKLLLTGDANLIRAHWVLRYRLTDPSAWLLRSNDPEHLLSDEFARAITRVTAAQETDRAIRTEVDAYRAAIADELSRRLEHIPLGVRIERIESAALHPPPPVAPAFEDVVAAENERSERISRARGYASRTGQETAGQVAQIRAAATAEVSRIVFEARSDAESFERLLAEYRVRPELVRRSLWQESIRRIMGRLKDRYVLPPKTGASDELRIWLGPEALKPRLRPAVETGNP